MDRTWTSRDTIHISVSFSLFHFILGSFDLLPCICKYNTVRQMIVLLHSKDGCIAFSRVWIENKVCYLGEFLLILLHLWVFLNLFLCSLKDQMIQ